MSPPPPAPEIDPSAAIHETARVEHGAAIGARTAVWDHVHVRAGARIGRDCIVGEKTYVAYDVHVGDLVKINTSVYLCAGVTIGDGVMLSAHVVFTNDRFPRATDPELTALRPSAPDEDTLATHVDAGATVGAAAVIGPGVRIGCWAMVGMGAVVTRDVPAHALVVGNPARLVGVVCRCGSPVQRFDTPIDLGRGPATPSGTWSCDRCGRSVTWPGEA